MKAAPETETQYVLPFKIPAEFVHDNGDVRELGLDPILCSVLTDQQTPTQLLETFAYFLQTIYEGGVDLKAEGIDTSEVPEQIQDFVCEVYLHRAPLSDCLAPTFTRKSQDLETVLYEFCNYVDRHDLTQKMETATGRISVVGDFLDLREERK